ncbi:MAG: cytochrome c maturation protein CcmE [Chloroflexi bacterium]|nr:MAG: cytochrome c maturation protein CcmE [Chloroflexota bacterium]RLT52538.1 MAG: cytochrome c maturation protein CcmE [Chloroflexota bacterium]
MTTTPEAITTAAMRPARTRFLVGGGLLLAAIVYLILTTAAGTSTYYYTIAELRARGGTAVGEPVRISGAVLGDSIVYDADTLELRFTTVNIPGEQSEIDARGGLAAVLHAATTDPRAVQLPVVYHGPRPDLLRHEAQAILTGQLGADGVFHADELLLKCPTRYEQQLPQQSASR